ncbi:hypothetical protein BDQ12DRAFT_672276 [Crucibulum laeve]|uniref:PWWP domain-containing protein n=1 Tax=Crucibulum laeve TaxID=68775 RepID=A0A5C3MGK6_9AGAR|nr:hypothetical protein BDQ12DRAFT_672276 [Crucibulum laeve]
MSKKGTKTPKEVKEAPSYDVRDIVLGKVRGFPPWPGMIVDPESVPPSVSHERPSAKKTTFYCVRFFPTGDYAWLVSKDISKLQRHEVESYINEPFKKSADLLAGYRIALDPKSWEEERDAMTHDAVEAEANAEIDQLESEADEDASEKKASKSKKRKRESDVTSAAKPKKAPKAKKEKEASAEGTEGKKKKSSSAVSAGKGRKNGAKNKAVVESEDEGDAAEAEAEDEEPIAGGPSKKASPPPTKKAKKEKEDEGDDSKFASDPEATKVRDWRHKLQKAFLSKPVHKVEDMPALDALFNTVENYDAMTVEYLTFSKIGKVMRHIAVLEDGKVPRDDEFKFRDRAKSLVDKWHQILNANKTGENGKAAKSAGDKSDEGKHGVNGDKEDASKDEGVTEGTAALSLNGKNDTESPAVDAEGDISMLGDVTMSEA